MKKISTVILTLASLSLASGYAAAEDPSLPPPNPTLEIVFKDPASLCGWGTTFSYKAKASSLDSSEKISFSSNQLSLKADESFTIPAPTDIERYKYDSIEILPPPSGLCGALHVYGSSGGDGCSLDLKNQKSSPITVWVTAREKSDYFGKAYELICTPGTASR